VSGIFFLIIGVLNGMKRVITRRAFDVDLMIDIFKKYEVSTFLTAPYAIVQLLAKKDLQPLRSIRALLIGGAMVSKSVSQAIKLLIPNGKVHVAYGTTEVDFLSLDKIIPNVQLKVVDENFKNLGPNQQGEICAKVSVNFSGYIDDAEKTEAAFRDGWYLTGDIGYLDEHGHVYIVDRKKDMLKYNNYQVYPADIESLINQIEGVYDSCVVGVLDKNKGNDMIYAFVQRYQSQCEVTAERIMKYVHNQVIDAKKLRGGVHFIEKLPTTPSGKVQRNEVKKLAEKIHETRAMLM
jgi:4-coumarate--CoA ligase